MEQTLQDEIVTVTRVITHTGTREALMRSLSIRYTRVDITLPHECIREQAIYGDDPEFVRRLAGHVK